MAAGSPLEAQDHGGHAERGQEWVPHAGDSGYRGLGCLSPKGEALSGVLRQPRPAASFQKLLCPSTRAAASQGASAFPSCLPIFSLSCPFLSHLYFFPPVVHCGGSPDRVLQGATAALRGLFHRRSCFLPLGMPWGIWVGKKGGDLGKNCFCPHVMTENTLCPSSMPVKPSHRSFSPCSP